MGIGLDTLKGGRQVRSQECKWFPKSLGAMVPVEAFFSDAHLIEQLANWIIDQIFAIELGRGNGSDCHETRRNGPRRVDFRPKNGTQNGTIR